MRSMSRMWQGRRLIDHPVHAAAAADGKGFDVIARAKEAELRYEPKRKVVVVDMQKCDLQHCYKQEPSGSSKIDSGTSTCRRTSAKPTAFRIPCHAT